MSYYDFLDFIFTPISYFVQWLSSVSNNLIHNYIFITFFGITIFISLFFLLINFIIDFCARKSYEYEDFNNLYDDYVKRQKVKYKYFENHYSDLYSYNYKIRVMNEQIYNQVSLKNKDLLLDNKINSLKINREALEKINDFNVTNEKVFSIWKDKETGTPLSKKEQKILNDLVDNF